VSVAKNKYPKEFKEGQVFTWKSMKDDDIIGVVTGITEDFVYMERTFKDKKDEIMFSPDSLKARLKEGTVIWLNPKD